MPGGNLPPIVVTLLDSYLQLYEAPLTQSLWVVLSLTSQNTTTNSYLTGVIPTPIEKLSITLSPGKIFLDLFFLMKYILFF